MVDVHRAPPAAPPDAEAGKRAAPRARGMTRRRRETLWFYILISPWLVGFVAFLFGPMLMSLYYSFTDFDLFTPPSWIGLDNYVRMFSDDPLFWKVLRNTVYYTLVSVPLHIILSLGLAALLHKPLPGMRVFRTVVYLPALVPLVASAMLFRWVLAPDIGMLNKALALVGVTGPAWLLSEAWVMPALILLSLWSVGTGVVLLLAGMQGIPAELYESAAIDGASRTQRFWRITVPMLSPIILFNLVMGLIAAFQTFSQVYILTNASATGSTGGPNNSALLLVPYLFDQGFRFYHMGYASALSWVLFAIIMLATLVVFRSSSAWVFYESEVRR